MRTIISIAFLMASILVNGQLRGSGNTVQKTFNYTNFDKISFENLDGILEVEIGKSFSISVTIDDNLENLLQLDENTSEHLLTVRFKNNSNNKKYIEDTHFKIRITMPEASVIKNTGNSNLHIKNVIGRYFRLENNGNGDVVVNGKTDFLEVINYGNGNTDASRLVTQKAEVKNTGNGDSTVNASEILSAQLIGNGNITNKGKAKFDSQSTKKGNGDFITQ
jgi:hypothetical protein